MKPSFLFIAALGIQVAAQAQTPVTLAGEAALAPTSYVLPLPTTAAGASCASAVGTYANTVTVVNTYVENFSTLPELAKGDGKPCGEEGCLAPHFDGGMENGTTLHAGYLWPSKRRQQAAYEQQTYVDTRFKGLGLQPFSVKDGVLSITARRADDELTGDALFGGVFTSGLLSTHQKFAQQYGYFEVRTQIPAGGDQLPAFWMLPVDRSWPPEIDIMESLVQGTVSQGAHWKSAGGNAATSCKNSTIRHSEGMHTYGALWTPERIVYYIDRAVVAQMASKPGQNQPFYMMVNLAIGGNYVGFVGRTDIWYPRTMQVDYIAAYTDKARPCTPSKHGDTNMITCK